MTGLSAPAATAVRAIAGVLVRHAITAAGSALVAKGYLDQATADSAVGPIAEQVIGVGVAVASVSWGVVRVRLSHGRFAKAWAILTAQQPPA